MTVAGIGAQSDLMALSSLPTHFNLHFAQSVSQKSTRQFEFRRISVPPKPGRRRKTVTCSIPDDATKFISKTRFSSTYSSSSRSYSNIRPRAADDATPQKSTAPELRGLKGDSSVALFISMLGIDKDQLDREQAVEALWRYSLGGKECVDAIMQFHGCLILIVNLLKSDSSSASEAAAGLLREISSVSLYRDDVAENGAIELEGESKSPSEPTKLQGFTLLPLTDGVARLVIILELEDDSAVARAAESVADSSINEHMRVAFKEAGAVKRLVKLLNHQNDAVRFAVTRALDRLSASEEICQTLETESVIRSLFHNLKASGLSDSNNVIEKTLGILSRILEPSKQMRKMFQEASVNGATEVVDATEDKRDSSSISWTDVLDSSVILFLVEILKNSSSNQQRKAASILEFASETEACIDKIVSADIGSALTSALQPKLDVDFGSDTDQLEEEPPIIELEESGLAISALSRLLTKLLNFKGFTQTIDPNHFTSLLRQILKSDIPLSSKEWVAACLVKLASLPSPYSAIESPITTEVTLYETIPRLIQTIKTSTSSQAQEAAAIELNRIVSEGIADSTKAVASEGGIFPLVKLLDEGTPRAVESALTVLYNLSMDPENHSLIMAAGAVPILKRIVLSEGPHWTQALRLLRTLPT
ncbi:hypothetical protein QQ045_020908 [Rhodiola kirilowii]